MRVKDIHHVVGSIGYAPSVGILLTHTATSQLPPTSIDHPRRTDLSGEDELEKFIRIDPAELVEDG